MELPHHESVLCMSPFRNSKMDLTAGKLRCDLAAKLTREQLVYYVIDTRFVSIFYTGKTIVFSPSFQPMSRSHGAPLLLLL